MIVLLIVAFAVLILIDVPELKKNKQWKELIIYCIFMALAFTNAALRVLDVETPIPAKETQYVVSWLFEQMNLYYE